jgi:hypothetical protein
MKALISVTVLVALLIVFGLGLYVFQALMLVVAHH